MSLIIVLISNPDKKTAQKIAKNLLENRLAACVQIFPAESAYWWKGKIENAKEYVTLAKTIPENFEKIKQEIKKIHPYECPEILKIGAEANEEYENWIKEEMKTENPRRNYDRTLKSVIPTQVENGELL